MINVRRLFLLGMITLILAPFPSSACQDNSAMRFRQGWAKYKNNEHQEAITLFSQVINDDPRHIEALFWRGRAYLALEDFASSVKDFDQVIALDAKFSSAYLYRGNTKKKMLDHEGADADWRRAGELDATYRSLLPTPGSTTVTLPGTDKSATDVTAAIAGLSERISSASAQSLSGDTVSKILVVAESLLNILKGSGAGDDILRSAEELVTCHA